MRAFRKTMRANVSNTNGTFARKKLTAPPFGSVETTVTNDPTTPRKWPH